MHIQAINSVARANKPCRLSYGCFLRGQGFWSSVRGSNRAVINVETDIIVSGRIHIEINNASGRGVVGGRGADGKSIVSSQDKPNGVICSIKSIGIGSSDIYTVIAAAGSLVDDVESVIIRDSRTSPLNRVFYIKTVRIVDSYCTGGGVDSCINRVKRTGVGACHWGRKYTRIFNRISQCVV